MTFAGSRSLSIILLRISKKRSYTVLWRTVSRLLFEKYDFLCPIFLGSGIFNPSVRKDRRESIGKAHDFIHCKTGWTAVPREGLVGHLPHFIILMHSWTIGLSIFRRRTFLRFWIIAAEYCGSSDMISQISWSRNGNLLKLKTMLHSGHHLSQKPSEILQIVFMEPSATCGVGGRKSFYLASRVRYRSGVFSSHVLELIYSF